MRAHFPGPAHVALAVGSAGLGVLCLVYGNFGAQWLSLPAWLPAPHAVAYAAGAVLVAGAVGLMFERVAARAAFVLTVFQLLSVLVRAKDLLPALTSIGAWQGFSEGIALLVGTAVLCGSLASADDPRAVRALGDKRAVRVARVLFGGACIAFGLAHFKYAEFTGGMVPTWLPARLELAYATGIAHIAVGLALITTVLDRLAATLEACMLAGFVVLVHVPSLVASPAPRWAPGPQSQWTELLLALSMAASAAVIARALRDRPWTLRRASA
jgi:uncharacterized membrane protein